MEDGENKEEIIEGLENRKAKTRKGNIILKKRIEGELHEGSKNCLFISSNKRTEELRNFMQDLYNIQKPLTCYMPKLHTNLADILTKLNDLVDICIHNSCSFFFSIFSTKKKPSRFLLGRLYNNNLFDYYVFSLLSYIPISLFSNSRNILCDTKPIVLIQGTYFDQNEITRNLKNVLFDFFKHRNVDSVSTAGVHRLIVISACEATAAPKVSAKEVNESEVGTDQVNKPKVDQANRTVDGQTPHIMFFRQYLLKKEIFLLSTEGDLSPLEEIGPRFEFVLENCQVADYHLFQEATKNVHVELSKKRKKKLKKVKIDEFGNSIKKVYVQKQNFEKLHTRHTKLLNRVKKVQERRV
ncbi:brix domain containing protein [Plasmodium gonderi]|uniref:Ribosome production factor 2 homolog n=1 Tax=Plasmodium gonderi TaxID=77519 RepID=A0A1Y1JIR1_PLAGO|nr:brix domain containing protein [Plasmodium gonderi]GAW79984.1 brix domain containing protein [Plasmodium gonderi]